jgi:predicted nucleotidyltransferase
MKQEQVMVFLGQVTRWAAGQADILGAALVGSYARNAASETSDVDLVLVADDPRKYLQNPGWMGLFGQVVQTQVEDYGLVQSIRAWYADGLEVEFGLTDTRWCTPPIDVGTRQVMEDGMRVLFERGSMLSQHLA